MRKIKVEITKAGGGWIFDIDGTLHVTAGTFANHTRPIEEAMTKLADEVGQEQQDARCEGGHLPELQISVTPPEPPVVIDKTPPAEDIPF